MTALRFHSGWCLRISLAFATHFRAWWAALRCLASLPIRDRCARPIAAMRSSTRVISSSRRIGCPAAESSGKRKVARAIPINSSVVVASSRRGSDGVFRMSDGVFRMLRHTASWRASRLIGVSALPRVGRPRDVMTHLHESPPRARSTRGWGAVEATPPTPVIRPASCPAMSSLPRAPGAPDYCHGYCHAGGLLGPFRASEPSATSDGKHA